MSRAQLRSKVRNELLVHPYELPLMFILVVIAALFLIVPEALEHTPVSFETRGWIHHGWHALLFVGAALNLTGRFVRGEARSLWMQFVGLAIILACLALNFTALIAGEVDGSGTEPLGGLDVALRAALMIGIGVRLYIIRTRATVELGASRA